MNSNRSFNNSEEEFENNQAPANMDAEGFVVRLRGLPWSAGNEEIANFLEGCNVTSVNFTFVRDGRPSGEAYVELASEDDVSTALEKNQHHMGKRYIEVFKSKRSEMDWVVERSGRSHLLDNSDSVIRLRGLPFECTKEDISNFFEGLSIVPNGISLLTDQMGRATGDAYVQFTSQPIADRALQKHKEKIGRRYVEIFKSTLVEARTAINEHALEYSSLGGGGSGGGGGFSRPSPYGRMDKFMGSGRGLGYGGGRGMGLRGNIKGVMSRYDDGFDGYGYGGGSSFRSRGFGGGRMGMGGGGMRRGGMFGSGMGGMGRGGPRGGMRGGRGRGGGGGGGMGYDGMYVSKTGHSIHMRGLPYSATENDIVEFFSPIPLENVIIGYNNEGRPSGEADVEFATHEEAVQGMKRNNAMMERRYIELFLHSGEGPSYGGDNYRGDNEYCENYTSSSGFGSNYTEF